MPVNDFMSMLAARALHVVWEMCLDMLGKQYCSDSVLKAIFNLTVLYFVMLWKKEIIQQSWIVLSAGDATLQNTNITRDKWIIKRTVA